jgi:hypothetical protein
MTAATKWKWNEQVPVLSREKKQDPAASILREVRDKNANKTREDSTTNQRVA